MRSMRLGWLGAAVSLLPMLVGCTDRGSNSSAGQATDPWLGQWNGPEGTFLKLEGGKGKYQVTIQNLDGPRTFSGRAADDEIQFERDGVKETIRATNGVETGMKWLAGKTDCLTIKTGEGYCRD
jgi:hypothetical protein